jgi:hypothetical protein
MSRLYESASEGRWCNVSCPCCDGHSQQRRRLNDQPQWWWGNPLDVICGHCRAEVEADAREAWEREQEERANQIAWEATVADEQAAFDAHWARVGYTGERPWMN